MRTPATRRRRRLGRVSSAVGAVAVSALLLGILGSCPPPRSPRSRAGPCRCGSSRCAACRRARPFAIAAFARIPPYAAVAVVVTLLLAASRPSSAPGWPAPSPRAARHPQPTVSEARRTRSGASSRSSDGSVMAPGATGPSPLWPWDPQGQNRISPGGHGPALSGPGGHKARNEDQLPSARTDPGASGSRPAPPTAVAPPLWPPPLKPLSAVAHRAQSPSALWHTAPIGSARWRTAPRAM
jgi:hypothetical protein